MLLLLPLLLCTCTSAVVTNRRLSYSMPTLHADIYETGSLSKSDLEVYLLSIFKVLMAVEGPSDVSPAVLAAFTTRQCLKEVGVGSDGRITVEQFIDWYAPADYDDGSSSLADSQSAAAGSCLDGQCADIGSTKLRDVVQHLAREPLRGFPTATMIVRVVYVCTCACR